MMYTHTITVYSGAGRLVKTISDGVDMEHFGIADHPGITHGAPVEATFTPDHRYAYVSNYSMYGVGFGPEGHDVCTPQSALAAGDTPSYVYRIALQSLSIDQLIKVGLVPKFLAVTPDGRYLLVSNWCSYDLSVIDVSTGQEIRRIAIGAYPRGIAVTADSSTAYVAEMGSDDVDVVDLRTMVVSGIIPVGPAPRQVVLGPGDRYLYVTLNGAGSVVKVDLRSKRVIDRVGTGADPRSMAIAPDGRTLYVVNYRSDTVSVLRASDMRVLQDIATGPGPIGITYDATNNTVWVAVYTGTILVFRVR